MEAADEFTRRVSVPRSRLAGWLQRYRHRHHGAVVHAEPDLITLRSHDGAAAAVTVPFPPLGLAARSDPLTLLIDHVDRDRRIGVVLVRRGGFAVGVFAGDQLLESKVGTGYVQGRTKAGGWSQQRYARRRAQQAQQLYGSAADLTARLLLPVLETLDAVVTGGDREGVQDVLADRRLVPLAALVRPGLITTGDPRLRVLQEAGVRMLDVTIALNELA